MTTQSNRCAVCLKSFDDPRWVPCKHMYCFKCIPQLHRRELDTNDQIVLECRLCSALHQFRDWSSAKYYITLNCVPYLTALQLKNGSSSISTTVTKCSACFNIPRSNSIDDVLLEYCDHCEKNVCHECLIDHRNELKKQLLQVANQCRSLLGKKHQRIKQILNQFETIKMRIDLQAMELTEKVEIYSDSLQNQIDEHFNDPTMISSGYESLLCPSDMNRMDSIVDQDQNQNEIITCTQIPQLTSSTIISIDDLLGEFIPSISPIRRFLWSMTCPTQPSHLIFEPTILKLFACSFQGDVSVFDYSTSSPVFVNTFSLNDNTTQQSLFIRSFTVSASFLSTVTNSPSESIVHIYSHTGLLLCRQPLLNECISQIRFDNDQLWCLELVSSTLLHFTLSPDIDLSQRTHFVSFKPSIFDPFRFALNQTFVAIIDRSSAGIVLLFDKCTSSQLKQITSPLNNSPLSDIELSQQILIYRSSHRIFLQRLSNSQHERIDFGKNLSMTKGKFENEILISTLASDNHSFNIQCYIQTV